MVYHSIGTMNDDHWLGMQRNSTREGTAASKYRDWHWFDGTSFNFYNWDSGEPDTNAQCAVVTPRGAWRDEYCDQTKMFICKKGTYHQENECHS